MDPDRLTVSVKTDHLKKIQQMMLEKSTAHWTILKKQILQPLPTGKNKKVTGMMTDEMGGKIVTKFATVGPKTWF